MFIIGQDAIQRATAAIIAIMGLLSTAPAAAQKHSAVAASAGDYSQEIPTWTKEGILAGASSSKQNCSLSSHVWVVDGEDGFCIRFFTSHAKLAPGPAAERPPSRLSGSSARAGVVSTPD